MSVPSFLTNLTVYEEGIAVHFAYSVVTVDNTVEEADTRFVKDESEYQPSNVLSLFVGSGKVPYVLPTVYCRALHELPPFELNDTVTFVSADIHLA